MIETAVQSGSNVKVYGNGNHLLFQVTGELVGYTSTTVSVKNGGSVKTYDDKNHLVSIH